VHPSNILTLDNDVIGCGGLPRGRVIEIYGQESSGKTALSLHIAGECQKAGGVVAFIDAEHSLDPSFANLLVLIWMNLLRRSLILANRLWIL